MNTCVNLLRKTINGIFHCFVKFLHLLLPNTDDLSWANALISQTQANTAALLVTFCRSPSHFPGTCRTKQFLRVWVYIMFLFRWVSFHVETVLLTHMPWGGLAADRIKGLNSLYFTIPKLIENTLQSIFRRPGQTNHCIEFKATILFPHYSQ